MLESGYGYNTEFESIYATFPILTGIPTDDNSYNAFAYSTPPVFPSYIV
jgi:hypothetical protein